MKNRISIRGMAAATAVVAASTGVVLGLDSWTAGDQVAGPAAVTGPLPDATDRRSPDKPSGAVLADIDAQQRRAAGRVRAARESREARERAGRSASRVPTFGGGARGIAANIAAEQYGWGAGQFSCIDSLWERESGWNHRAQNPSSGAYGIPQALPGSKMSAHGSDWRTNPVTQIQWGLAYVDATYGTPCGAWSTFRSQGWY